MAVYLERDKSIKDFKEQALAAVNAKWPFLSQIKHRPLAYILPNIVPSTKCINSQTSWFKDDDGDLYDRVIILFSDRPSLPICVWGLITAEEARRQWKKNQDHATMKVWQNWCIPIVPAAEIKEAEAKRREQVKEEIRLRLLARMPDPEPEPMPYFELDQDDRQWVADKARRLVETGKLTRKQVISALCYCGCKEFECEHLKLF
jgi:hypothetical protein